MLPISTTAPEFSLPDQNEVIHTLSQYKGKWVILYFYPKDDTPGCTKEACTIAEVYNDFSQLGVTVLGVSKDTPASHKKFAEKYNLPFTLLSDESTSVMQAYEAWKKKLLFGKNFLGTLRVTYIINPEGKIAKTYPNVDPANHALNILADLKTLI